MFGIQTPIFVGIGGLILGVILMFASWPFFPEFFRRRVVRASPIRRSCVDAAAYRSARAIAQLSAPPGSGLDRDAVSAPMTEPQSAAGSGIPSSELPGPYPVGSYAAQLRGRLREFARVQLVGEVWGVPLGPGARVLRAARRRGALPCSMWRNDFEALGVDAHRRAAGRRRRRLRLLPRQLDLVPLVQLRGPELRIAGEGDLLVQLERLRRRLAADGLFEPQKRLPRPLLPRTIGVVTGEQGKARDDVLAGLRRRGWAGRLVWAFAPVQDRHAAPRDRRRAARAGRDRRRSRS